MTGIDSSEGPHPPTTANHRPALRHPRRGVVTGLLMLSMLVGGMLQPSRNALAQVSLPQVEIPQVQIPGAIKRLLPGGTTPAPDADRQAQPITVFANNALKWDEDGVTVLLLRGQCRVTQGDESLQADQMILWLGQQTYKGTTEDQLAVYAEGDARIVRPEGSRPQEFVAAELTTHGGTHFIGRPPQTGAPQTHDPVYQRGIERTQFQHPTLVTVAQTSVPDLRSSGDETGPQFAQQLAPFPSGMPGTPQRRHVTIGPRYLDVPYVIKSRLSNSTPPELIVTVTRGVNLVLEGAPVMIDGVMMPGIIDLTADRAVIFTDPERVQNLAAGFDLDTGTRLQVYLEGNIVVRQGNNVVRATNAYYDLQTERGLLLNAELRSFIPQLEGDLRVRASRVRQLSRDNFHAQNAWASASQFGKPGYRLEASDIFIERRPGNPYPWIAPDPNDPAGGSAMWVTSLNNRFLIGDTPVFATPFLSAPAEDPQIPIRDVRLDHDRIFGTQFGITWNAEALFGLDLPPGTDVNLLTDYLSDRGPMIGGEADYEGATELFGAPTLYNGMADLDYINDGGRDNLGRDRRSLPLESANRGLATWRNRLRMPGNYWLTTELGYISDRNYLEQYDENDWDEGKDHETLIEFGQQVDNMTWSILGSQRLNDFANVTEWARGDITILGQPLLSDWLTWSSHSSIGHGRVEPADAPFNPAQDVFTPLPFYTHMDGLVAMTRHEIDLPFMVGPVNVVPYLLGEAAYWDEDATGNDLSRLYGSAGVRASILFTKYMPYVQNRVWGLNGLAHKMLFDLDWSISDSSQPLAAVPQYNEFDDNAQERFRERFFTTSFGGALPATFEPRNYAVRTGAGSTVTAPYHELVDDLHVLRLGWRHRWQTKVGPPNRLRVKDWMTLDLEASLFPDAMRDNFGEDFGLLGANYRWYVGERTTLLAGALYDTFTPNQQTWNVGVLSQRSARGSIYLGLRQIQGGPVDSQIVTASYSYLMSPKWASSFSTAYDLAEGENRGQSLTISRIGGDWVFHLGVNYDASKDNAGIGIAIEPRLGHLRTSRTQLSSLLGVR